MTAKKFKVSDRVKKISNQGCLGTVREVRQEVTNSNQESREKNVMVYVLWDNGTLSSFTTDALETV